jgi:NAD(P)-dependent dehydrogenase (short-subunit alcohol dehydrogenase family)
MELDFVGKRAVVCGGSRGIGRAIARAGAAVSICVRGAETLEATRAEIAGSGHPAHAAVWGLRQEHVRSIDHVRSDPEGVAAVVWKLDRLSRSLKDVLHIMERIGNADAGFRSITVNVDTTTPVGRKMMQMVGVFAEFERAMIRERTSAGLAAARAQGHIGGRRKKLDVAKRREIAESVSLVGSPGPTWHCCTTSASRQCLGSSQSIAIKPN